MIDFKDFVERYYPSANIAQRNDIKRFLDNLLKIIGDTPLNEALKNTQVLHNSFYLQKVGNDISRPHYQKIKGYLNNLIDFLDINSTIPTREEVLTSQNTMSYFKGIDDLFDFIDKVGNSLLADYDPTKDLVRIKSICVLGWLGFSPDEIANIKIDDLSRVDTIGYRLINKMGSHEIYGKSFLALFYLTELKEYSALPSGKKTSIKGNEEYLLRPTVANCEKLDGEAIIQIIKRFNNCIPPSMKTSIMFRNLYKNALFIEVYNDKSDKSIIQKIISVMRCSPNYALNYKAQYIKFAENLDKNKI